MGPRSHGPPPGRTLYCASPLTESLRRTPLFPAHQAAGGRMVPFAGWELPVRYGSIVDEHLAVRSGAGMFDVSHMGRYEVAGPGAAAWLDRAVSSDIGALTPGRGRYGLLCEEDGGVVDDVIVSCLAPGRYLVVVNASNREADWQFLEARRGDDSAGLTDLSDDLAMIAVQGPRALEVLQSLATSPLHLPRRFAITEAGIAGVPCVVARTGYTGEDGAELLPPASQAIPLWNALRDAGITPCGLGARDTLRLEAGLPLYGHELDRDHTPLDAGLGWALAWDKPAFSGKAALEAHRADPHPRVRLAGVKAFGRDIPRDGARLLRDGQPVGTITSGTFSPTLQAGIGMAWLRPDLCQPGTSLDLELRDRTAPVEVTRLPFVPKAT